MHKKLIIPVSSVHHILLIACFEFEKDLVNVSKLPQENCFKALEIEPLWYLISCICLFREFIDNYIFNNCFSTIITVILLFKCNPV